MWRFIDYLRSKPKGVRIQVAYVAAFICTGLIGSAWLFANPIGSSSSAIVESGEEGQSFSLIFDQAKNQFGQVIDGFKNIVSTDVASSTASTTKATESAQAVVMPELGQSSTTNTWTQPKPTGRPILIATTSVQTASSSQ